MFIDKSGERLLRAMSKKGAELVANGMYTKHVLEKAKTTSKRNLPKLLACLFTALSVSAMTHTECVRGGARPRGANVVLYLGPELKANNVSSRSDFTNGEGEILCPQNS
jgi:hypothetical protein